MTGSLIEIGLDRFPLKDLLQRRRIPFTEDHHNLSKKCLLGVNCWNCGDQDFHMGVFRDGGNYHCFRCGASGSLYRLAQALFGMTWNEFKVYGTVPNSVRGTAEESVKSILDRNSEKVSSRATDRTFGWPRVSYPISSSMEEGVGFQMLRRFLDDRGFDLEDAEFYQARYVGPAGEYACRILIPIFWKDRMIGFQARDLTGKAQKRYLNPPGFRMDRVLYEIDRVPEGSVVVLVEGVFDLWRYEKEMEDDETFPVATFGTKMTDRQVSLLLEKRPRGLVFFWDSDAIGKAVDLGKRLGGVFGKVRVSSLPNGEDPDSIGRKEGGEGLRRLVDGAETL